MEINKEDKSKSTKDKPHSDLTFEEYAKTVMTHSLFTGVPNIIETPSVCNKIFKVLVLLLCISGFIYQAVGFIQYVLTYPTTVEIELYSPKKYSFPALTFCNNNGIKRTLFCERYPDYCITLNSSAAKEYCDIHDTFCSFLTDKANITIVKTEYHNYEKMISFEELKFLGHTYDDMEVDQPYFSSNRHLITGPFMGEKEDKVRVLCYSVNLRVDCIEEPESQFTPVYVGVRPYDKMTFNAKSSEIFRPERIPGIRFHVHTPFAMENVITDGIFLRTGRYYFVRFTMEEDYLLEAPYKSNCLNYTQKWLKNDRRGPRSQKACKDKCYYDMMIKYCNCTSAELFHSTKGPYCAPNADYANICMEDENSDKIREELVPCFLECRVECQIFRYEYVSQFSFIEDETWTYSENKEHNSMVIVIVALDSYNILKYQHRPKYEMFDVLSSIGGFVGAWLGISLIAIFDLLESLIILIRYYCRRNARKRAALAEVRKMYEKEKQDRKSKRNEKKNNKGTNTERKEKKMMRVKENKFEKEKEKTLETKVERREEGKEKIAEERKEIQQNRNEELEEEKKNSDKRLEETEQVKKTLENEFNTFALRNL